MLISKLSPSRSQLGPILPGGGGTGSGLKVECRRVCLSLPSTPNAFWRCHRCRKPALMDEVSAKSPEVWQACWDQGRRPEPSLVLSQVGGRQWPRALRGGQEGVEARPVQLGSDGNQGCFAQDRRQAALLWRGSGQRKHLSRMGSQAKLGAYMWVQARRPRGRVACHPLPRT